MCISHLKSLSVHVSRNSILGGASTLRDFSHLRSSPQLHIFLEWRKLSIVGVPGTIISWLIDAEESEGKKCLLVVEVPFYLLHLQRNVVDIVRYVRINGRNMVKENRRCPYLIEDDSFWKVDLKDH